MNSAQKSTPLSRRFRTTVNPTANWPTSSSPQSPRRQLVLEEALLAEQFQILLEKQPQAASAYAGLAAKVTDPHLKLKIEQLCRDKEKHIRLAERLLEIVD